MNQALEFRAKAQRSQRICLDENELSREIIGAAIKVHRELGPGLLESTYEECLCRELSLRGFSFNRQVALPVEYKGVNLDCGYRIDLIVEDIVVVEIKSVTSLERVHSKQVLTCLKLSGKSLGLLINFNVEALKDGIRRLANSMPDA